MHCATPRAICHSCSVKVGPLELGSVVALRLLTSIPISMPLLSGKKKELEVSGFIFLLFFFFFLAKGLLPVSELWPLPPQLSLQLQCTDRLRGYVCVHVCTCVYFGEGCLFLVPHPGGL